MWCEICSFGDEREICRHSGVVGDRVIIHGMRSMRLLLVSSLGALIPTSR